MSYLSRCLDNLLHPVHSFEHRLHHLEQRHLSILSIASVAVLVARSCVSPPPIWINHHTPLLSLAVSGPCAASFCLGACWLEWCWLEASSKHAAHDLEYESLYTESNTVECLYCGHVGTSENVLNIEVSLLWRLNSSVNVALGPEMAFLIQRFSYYGGVVPL